MDPNKEAVSQTPSVLGLLMGSTRSWSCAEVNLKSCGDIVTTRNVLVCAHSLADPIGFTCLVTSKLANEDELGYSNG